MKEWRVAEMADDVFSIDVSASKARLEGVRRSQQEGVRALLSKMNENNRVPPPEETLGAHQRLQMRVPTAGSEDGTIISAGRRSGASFDGYAVKTNAHVAMSAEGGVAASTMTLQSNGQLMVQSDQASLFLLSTAPATLASTSVTNVAGAGVVIAAGGGAPVVMVPVDGGAADKPAVPESASGAASAAQAAADAWSRWDGAVSDATSARDELRRTMDPDRATEYAAPAQGAGAKGVLVDSNKQGEKSDGGAGGLVLHGEKSVLIGTPGTGAIRAAETLTISTRTLASIAHEDSELVAGRHLSATVAENASVMAGKRVDVVAHADVLHLASRTGEGVEIEGKALFVGEITPSDPQVITDNVFVRAKKHVSIGTNKDPDRAESADGVHVATHDVIVAKSDATVTVEAADTITLKIADKEIQLVVDKGGTIQIKTKDAIVALGDSNGVGLSHRNKELVRAKSDKVTVGTGPSDKLEIASGSVALKGGSIKIG